jgi:DNA-binding response OmpR family regulator
MALTRTCRILLAEDEPQLLRFYKIFLEDEEYEVVTARDGQECLDEYLRQQKDSFNLVILDHRMPRKNGMEAAKEIAALNPLQKLLMITAYSGVLDLSDRPANLKIIPKPFEVKDFISTIEVLIK